MKARAVSIILAAIVLVGIVLRVLAVAFEPPHHPDEYFQYLEPAWQRLRGAGIETWEWREGVRSWFLPGYHGAWMAALSAVGVRNGAVLIKILQAHWALLGLLLVWAGWRGGALLARWRQPKRVAAADMAPAGWQGGLVGAFLCATFPLLVRFSVHTFSEVASMICLVCALVLAGELSEEGAVLRAGKVVLLGLLLGVGFALRIQHLTVPFFAGLWLLWARRSRTFLAVSAIALVTVFLFGILDRLTWGELFASYVRYVRFNVLEDGAAGFGTQPTGWYLDQFLHRLPIGLYALALLCLVGLRASWPFVGSAVGLLALLSTQAHKEERFIMLAWPLLLIAAGGVVGRLIRSAVGATSLSLLPSPSWRLRVRQIVAGCALLAVPLTLVDGGLHYKGNDFEDYGEDYGKGRFAALAWVARQSDVTGLLYDHALYYPGYMGFSKPFPQLGARAELLSNPLFSHVLVPHDSSIVWRAEAQGFAKVFTTDRFVVLHRSPPTE